MYRSLSFAVAIFIVGVSLASAQVRIVNASGVSFTDTVSGTNQTTITLGTTVRWTLVNGTHTVTSGASPSTPGAGTLFNSNLNSSVTIFNFTPTSAGTISYYCALHFGNGMTGTITVLPPLLYPGTGENFELRTAVLTPGVTPYPAPTTGGGQDVKNIAAGQALTVECISTQNTFSFKPLLVVGQFFGAGSPPPGALTGLHVNTFGAFFLVNGADPGPLGGGQLVAPGGSFFNFAIPPGFTGQHLMIQALAIASNATNTFFAASEGHEIVFL